MINIMVAKFSFTNKLNILLTTQMYSGNIISIGKHNKTLGETYGKAY